MDEIEKRVIRAALLSVIAIAVVMSLFLYTILAIYYEEPNSRPLTSSVMEIE